MNFQERRRTLGNINSNDLQNLDKKESIRVPLCAYVEEEPLVQDDPDPNGPFKDPNLGCIKCQIEPYEQCEDVPKESCRLISDPDCQQCPKIQEIPRKRYISFDLVSVLPTS